jgi:threonine aldolase
MNFASDNTAGVAPEIFAALARANTGFALGYGNDATTDALSKRMAALFEREVAVFLVPTGTAANALAIAQFAPPWGAVLCHCDAHIAADECGAPEFYGGGLKLIELPGEAGKISVATLEAALAGRGWGGPHHVSPAVLSLTQATEAGTVYTPDEVAALAAVARRNGMAVHMDGARLANALAALEVAPADATWRAGVDVLSFGATKGGAMAAEAVVIFDPARAAGFVERRKRAGQLVSKHRFVAAQFEAFLADDLWLRLARHANAMAQRLAAALASAGLKPIWPVEANEIFVALPADLSARLKAEGAQFYGWSGALAPAGTITNDDILARLVTSFATTEAEIDRFAALLQRG